MGRCILLHACSTKGPSSRGSWYGRWGDTHGAFFGTLHVLNRASATAKMPISCKQSGHAEWMYARNLSSCIFPVPPTLTRFRRDLNNSTNVIRQHNPVQAKIVEGLQWYNISESLGMSPISAEIPASFSCYRQFLPVCRAHIGKCPRSLRPSWKIQTLDLLLSNCIAHTANLPDQLFNDRSVFNSPHRWTSAAC